jgi:haloalkane dehalogenase
MELLRTPDERFASLPDFPFEPRYVEIDGVRMAWVEAGPAEAAPILCLHGEPSWSFLYRKMIPILAAAGHRVIAPDLVGFGRSDKPAARADYTYQRHMDWLTGFLLALDLQRVTLVCQDWGGLLGLRLAAEQEARFARIVAANTFLPTGESKMPDAFVMWREFSQTVPEFPVGQIIAGGCKTALPPEVIAAYDAPFPSEAFKEGARQFPVLVPATPDDPAAPANRRAWEVLERWEKPFLTAFSDKDPITRGADAVLRKRIPGAKREPVTIAGGGHFLQEDRGEELAAAVNRFVGET